MKCGIIMPISEIDGCTAEHWQDVLTIFRDALETTEFEPNLVSDASETGVIQKRIVQNIHDNEMMICDVSGKNPNVMFELGMRLAFDKPTVVVKDDQTGFSFDTSVIEHLSYPRGLRHGEMEEFKSELAEKVVNTYKRATEDTDYTTFLKHFGNFTVAPIPTEQVSENQFIVKTLEKITNDIDQIKSNNSNPIAMLNNILETYSPNTVCVKGEASVADALVDKLLEEGTFDSAKKVRVNDDHFHISVEPNAKIHETKIRNIAKKLGLRVSWVR